MLSVAVGDTKKKKTAQTIVDMALDITTVTTMLRRCDINNNYNKRGIKYTLSIVNICYAEFCL